MMLGAEDELVHRASLVSISSEPLDIAIVTLVSTEILQLLN